MAVTFTRTGAQIEEIHNTVDDPKSNAQFSDDIRTIAGEYRGLWPDTGGSANKGDTYQTQVSGTPTGKYFTALQITTSAPEPEGVNWRESINGTDDRYIASFESLANMISGTVNGISGSITPNENHTYYVRELNETYTVTSVADGGVALSGGLYARKQPSGIEVESDAGLSQILRSINHDARTNVVVIGDSITEGVAATEWKARYVNQFMQSLQNSVSQGYRYFGNARISKDFDDTNKSTTGTFISSGVVNDALQLDDGETITLNNYQARNFDVIYNADLSSGALELRVNGHLAATHSISGSGQQTSYPSLSLVQDTIETDAITITSSGGSVVVNSLSVLAHSIDSTPSQYGFIIPRSGWAYQNFNTSSQMDLIAEYSNFANKERCTFFIMLGTNNIYNTGYNNTPSEYLTEMSKLVDGLTSRVSGSHFYISVPPKGGSSWSPIAPYVYEDYVATILRYCSENGHTPIRFDLVDFAGKGLIPDGIHPSDDGMALMSKVVCDTVGVEYNPDIYSRYESVNKVVKGIATYNDLWSPLSSFSAKVIENNGLVSMTGFANQNASTSRVMCTLPPQYRPVSRDIYTTCQTQSGLETLVIYQNGDIEVGNLPGGWVSLDSVHFLKRS
jgi:lysophospholipase L1-like esterase